MKKIIYSLLIGVSIISCSRDEDVNVPNISNQEDNVPLLPVQFDDIKYTYTDGNKLETAGNYTFKYEGELIKSIKYKNSNKEIVFEYDNKDRLIKVIDGEQTTTFNHTGLHIRSYKQAKDDKGYNKYYQLSYTSMGDNILSANGWSWDDNPDTPNDFDNPIDVRIWLGYDNYDNYAKNIVGLDKISIYLVDSGLYSSIKLLGAKNNPTYYSYVHNGFSSLGRNFNTGYGYERGSSSYTYIYNEKNLPIGFKNNILDRNGYTNDKEIVIGTDDKVYTIRYNK